MLGLRGLRASRGGRFAAGNFAADKTRISFLELRKRRIRAHGSDRMIHAKNTCNGAKQTNERDLGWDLHSGCDYEARQHVNASTNLEHLERLKNQRAACHGEALAKAGFRKEKEQPKESP